MKQTNESHIQEKYGSTHTIEKRAGTFVDLRLLKENQIICYGDGKTFHWLLTEKNNTK